MAINKYIVQCNSVKSLYVDAVDSSLQESSDFLHGLIEVVDYLTEVQGSSLRCYG